MNQLCNEPSMKCFNENLQQCELSDQRNIDIKRIKNELKLDFDCSSNCLKRKLSYSETGLNEDKNNSTGTTIWTPCPVNAVTLDSPDLKMLKLASPEIEKYILNNANPNLTPTPSITYKHSISNLENANSELVNHSYATNSSNNGENSNLITEDYHSVNESRPLSSASYSSYQNYASNDDTAYNSDTSHATSANCHNGYTESENGYQSLNSKSIDMLDQEVMKLERKRLRNRIAASKCRKKKLERISNLEDKVKQLKGENLNLTTTISLLKENVYQLKMEVANHIRNGCSIKKTFTMF